MPLHITDPATDAAARELAAARGISITEAVRIACREMLAIAFCVLTESAKHKDASKNKELEQSAAAA